MIARTPFIVNIIGNLLHFEFRQPARFLLSFASLASKILENRRS